MAPPTLVLLPILIALTLLAPTARAQDGGFSFASVEAMASQLAKEPYKVPRSIEGEMKGLGYDKYLSLRSRPDTALWRDTKSPFRVEFFPAGFIYEKPVQISVVENGVVSAVPASVNDFDFSDTGLQAPPKEFALAGFRLLYPLNRGDKFDEVIAYLGATYFRPVSRNQVYGASARGLAIDTGTGKPEEFPTFRAFWLNKPADDAHEMTIWALLDSPSATGAFSFIVRPGARTVIETHAVLFMRKDVSLLGIAPLTSMFLAGKASPARDDYRPEIHDSDGLALATGKGEVAWRPLVNPGALAVSSFVDSNPRGFGLLQRERDFQHYQDSAANLQLRPSLWIEPKGSWGDGEVRLIEIPTQAETNDNIVAFWVSRWPAKQGERKEYDYRIFAVNDEPVVSPLARVVATRTAAVPNMPKLRRVVVEYAGGDLAGLLPEQPVTAKVSLSSGKLARVHVEALPQKTWRVFIDFEPDGKKPTDMRATLELRGTTLTETWLFAWRP